MADETTTTSANAGEGEPGRSPFNPLVVYRRPTSYADALAQYRSARGYEDAARATGNEDELTYSCELVVDRIYNVMEQPSPTLTAVIEKLEMLRHEYGGVVEEDHSAALLADLRRLERVS